MDNTLINKYQKLRNSIPKEIKLIAVSKTQPMNIMEEAYAGGIRIFGENKALDLRDKYEALPKDIEWHFIGHLQKNKIKYIAPFVSLIHGVDSFDLLKEIDKFGQKNNRVLNCLLQFHIASEETKFGLAIDEAVDFLKSPDFKSLKNICICGVMGMATYTSNDDIIRKEFKDLVNIFKKIKSDFFANQESFKDISMGMSGDFALAIEEGSTMVRIGSSIFGSRL